MSLTVQYLDECSRAAHGHPGTRSHLREFTAWRLALHGALESVRRCAALAGNTDSGGQNWVPILPLALGRLNFSSWKLGVVILPSQGCCQDTHFKWLIAVGFHFRGKCFCDHPRENPYPERAMLQRDVKCTSWTRLFWKRQLGAALLLWVLLFFLFLARGGHCPFDREWKVRLAWKAGTAFSASQP